MYFSTIRRVLISYVIVKSTFSVQFLHDIKMPKGASAARAQGVVICEETEQMYSKHLVVSV